MSGGGDRSLGDIGQRGVSRISGLVEDFWGTGAFIVESEAVGCRGGIDAADNARWVAAAEGGFGVEVVERAGLTSCELFFLDRPGPFDVRPEVVDFRVGLFGDASREAAGEFAADFACFVCSFFVAGSEDVDELRVGLEAFDVCSVMSTGSAVSFAVPENELKDLSSMVVTFFFVSEETTSPSEL